MIWACMNTERQWNSSWLEEDGCEDWGSDGTEGCRTQGRENPFLPCFRHGQSIGENLLKNVSKFSNLALARNYPVTLLFPECPQSPFRIKPGGRLRLSASLDESEAPAILPVKNHSSQGVWAPGVHIPARGTM